MYDVPKVDVTSVARHSRAVTAGSMRGFGAFQTMTALEVLIDETAATLALDPVEFRRRNLLANGRKTMMGNAITGNVRCAEVLDRLAAKPLWTNRAAEKKRRAAASPDKLYGVGLSCLMMEYGSGSDPAYALVELDPSGRISLASQAVEIGNGIATALAVRVADKLGKAADTVKLGDLDSWDVLGLVAPDDPFSITAERQDEGAKNPRWVLDVGQDTTACNGAHVHTEAAAEAANIILRFGLFPAAKALWSAGAQTASKRPTSTCASRTSALSTASSPRPATHLSHYLNSLRRRMNWGSSPRPWSTATTAGPGRRPHSICRTAATRAPSMRWR